MANKRINPDYRIIHQPRSTEGIPLEECLWEAQEIFGTEYMPHCHGMLLDKRVVHFFNDKKTNQKSRRLINK